MPAASSFKKIKLSSGYEIPQIGMGVFLNVGENVSQFIYNTLQLGYRHFDSAQFYHNEEDVALGIAKFLAENPEAAKREDIYYTTKLNIFEVVDDDAYNSASKLITRSLEKAKSIGYIDLFLIHAPNGGTRKRLAMYKALQDAVDTGKVKSIGVSNYGVKHLKELVEWSELKHKPVVNQVELHPWLTRKEIVEFGRKYDIKPQAYSPLTRGTKLNDPLLLKLADKYNKTPAQILIRWSLQQGYITLPKSSHEDRAAQNLDVFDFEISDEDMKELTHDDEYWVSAPQWDPTKED